MCGLFLPLNTCIFILLLHTHTKKKWKTKKFTGSVFQPHHTKLLFTNLIHSNKIYFYIKLTLLKQSHLLFAQPSYPFITGPRNENFANSKHPHQSPFECSQYQDIHYLLWRFRRLNFVQIGNALIRLIFAVQTTEPGHNISYNIACTPSKDSDQPASPCSLIIIFA